MQSKKEFLDDLFYKIGKQSSQIELQATWEDKEGNKKWTKRKLYLEAQGDLKFIDKANNRSILDVEVVLDIDPEKRETKKQTKENFETIIQDLNKQNFSYKAYFTGSRGYHIHLIFPNLKKLKKPQRDQFREFLIGQYGCDLTKKSDRCMIALENTAHWKTGNPKKLVYEVEGINKTENIIKTIKQQEKEKAKKQIESKYIFDESKIFKEKIFPFFKLKEDLAGFGIYLPKDKEQYNKKGEYLGMEQVLAPVVITSNPQIMELSKEFRKKYMIKFQTDPENGEIQRRWSLHSIQNYIQGNQQQLNTKEFFQEIIKVYKKYLYFDNEEWYKVHALWDISTYFFLLSNYFPIFELRGLAGTAKSKVMTISRLFSFNATEEMTNPSEPTLFRETHEKRPTKYIDEAERLYIITKGKIEADPRAELINSGYKYTGSVPRQDKINNRYITVYFKTYSPTMVGSINGLYGATEDRAIIHTTVKPPKGDHRGKLEPDEHDKQYQDIRDSCYIFALQNWKQIEDYYLNYDIDTDLSNRDLNLWKLILVTAKTIDPELFKEVKSFAEKLTQIKSTDGISEGSSLFKILKIINDMLNEGQFPIFVKDISARFGEFCPAPKTIARHIDRVGFQLFKHRFEKGTGYEITQELFQNLIAPLCPSLLTTQKLSSQPAKNKPQGVVEEDILDPSVKLSDKVLAELIVKTIYQYGKPGDSIPYETLFSNISPKGISEPKFEELTNHLKKIGEIYEPKKGFLARV